MVNVVRSFYSLKLGLTKKQDNHPEELYSIPFIIQKLNYIYQNPVRAGIGDNAKEYLFNSARDYGKD
jgi:hypothetical protein